MSISHLIKSKFTLGKVSQAHLNRLEQRKSTKISKKTKIEDVKKSPIKKIEVPIEKVQVGPRLTVVDGKIQLDASSLLVTETESHINELENDLIEDRTNIHITSSSFRRKTTRIKWDQELTDLFYKVFIIIQGIIFFWNRFYIDINIYKF